MLVRLKAKLADVVNGIDLSHCEEGDIIELIDRDGSLLLAEGWAELAPPDGEISCRPKHVERAVANDEGVRGWRKAAAGPQWSGHRFHIVPPSSPEHEP